MRFMFAARSPRIDCKHLPFWRRDANKKLALAYRYRRTEGQ